MQGHNAPSATPIVLTHRPSLPGLLTHPLPLSWFTASRQRHTSVCALGGTNGRNGPNCNDYVVCARYRELHGPKRQLSDTGRLWSDTLSRPQCHHAPSTTTPERATSVMGSGCVRTPGTGRGCAKTCGRGKRCARTLYDIGINLWQMHRSTPQMYQSTVYQ